VGVYLPISTSSAMFAGGVVRWLIERRAQARQQSIADVESGPGVLFSSGLIAGGAICGIVLAAIAGVLGSADALAEKLPVFRALGALPQSTLVAFGLFAALATLLYRIGLRRE
jgi:OPT oligopeptide transporter protein